MPIVLTEVAGEWRKQGNANQKQQIQKRVVATAMGDDDGRRLTEDRRPVGSTWQQQQQMQKRVVAAEHTKP